MKSWYLKVFGSQMNRDEGALRCEHNRLIEDPEERPENLKSHK